MTEQGQRRTPAASNPELDKAFHVARWLDVFGGFVTRHKRLGIKLGNLETRLLAEPLAATRIDQPIYITGLARSGSTLLLEILAWLPELVSHRYRDYPALYTPYLWNRFLDYTPRQKIAPVERTHRDGILITPESPEAFEEILWMAFFPQLHDPRENAVLGARTDNSEFEAFYRDHIRKLILVRGGRRYLAKGNYNITRLEYLHRLFPDARFVIPVRNPSWHIASLMKQHALFCEGSWRNPRALSHLQRVGHYEFGLDRRPINAADNHGAVQKIVALWTRGAEVEGWARYWQHIHAYLADVLAHNRRLREATLVVRYEDLCRMPRETLRKLFEHCRLAPSAELLERAEQRIHFPNYYKPQFTEREHELIERYTAATAARFGLRHTEPALHP
ncbi:MAG: sulfotransferase [Nitrococcus mobilis]|nr:sulfotransferase [Nitrococcus mobilis]